MNIAIDISPLESGHKARGIGVYTSELTKALQQYGKKHTYQLIHRGQNVPASVDIVHYPYFDPFLQTLPVVKPKPTVVTVHDLIPLVFPEKFPKGIKGTLTWQVQKASLKGSRRIITDSRNSKKDIHRITGFNEDQIDIIPLAPRSIFRPIKDKSVLSSVRKKYRLPNNFILYVGDVNWNKNISGFLEAYAAAVQGKTLINTSLVLVGSAFLISDIPEVVEINRLIETLNIRAIVVRPGFVPDNDLAGIYNLATCLVQPSWYEGFGFPVLEAMVSGCPVITSNASALAEVAGPAVIIDPENVDSIVIEIRKMITISQEKRMEFVQKGFEWAAQFTWQKVARETIQSYERAVL
jgi:glycosyltransferase involved in cell wall biosynthesis